MTTPLYNIGEHVYDLSEDFKKAHSDIPWVKIAGLGTGWSITMRTPTGS